jgi:toxin ParE1/3/4
MPERRAYISPKALEDIKAIEDDIAEQSGEARADVVVARIDKAMDTLTFMPGIGNPRAYLEAGVRAFSVAPWTIYYRPLPDGIRVLRVLDGRRNLPALFEP